MCQSIDNPEELSMTKVYAITRYTNMYLITEKNASRFAGYWEQSRFTLHQEDFVSKPSK